MNSDVWDAQIEVFKSMTPPLRPHSSEIAILEEVAANLAESSRNSRLHVLLLGVTTEIVHLNWPKDTMLTAVDRSEFMIHHFWPGDIPNRRKLIRADWSEMSFPESTFHLIIGDGVHNFMSYPDGYRNLARILSRLLRPDGLTCIRIFNQPEQKEKPEEILKDFHQSQQVNYYEFRFRLGTSLQKSVEEGINASISELIDQYLIDHGITLSEFYEKSGYRPPDIPPLPGPKNHRYRLSYPTDKEYVEQVSRHFNVTKKLNGSHRLSHRTPIFILSPK